MWNTRIAASGFILKNPEKGMVLLLDLNLGDNVVKTLELSRQKKIKVQIDYDCDPVYTKVEAIDKSKNKVVVIIEKEHDNITSVKINNNETIEKTLEKKRKKQIDFAKYSDF